MPNRTSPRHPFFDYRTPAAYFVTVCTHHRRRLFGAVQQGRMYLNAIGTIVAEEWRRSEPMRDEVLLDAFVVMPDHLHGIVCLVPPDVDAVSPRGYDLHAAPTPSSTENAPTDAYVYGNTDDQRGRPPDHCPPSWPDSNPPRPNGSISIATHRAHPSGNPGTTTASSGMNENGGPAGGTLNRTRRAGTMIEITPPETTTHDLRPGRIPLSTENTTPDNVGTHGDASRRTRSNHNRKKNGPLNDTRDPSGR